MQFKHTFNVFVDNFKITYKQLLFRLIIGIIAFIICFLGFSPVVKGLVNSDSFNALFEGVKEFFLKLLNGEMGELNDISIKIQDAYEEFMILLGSKTTEIVLSVLLILLVYVIAKWFAALGNYATASLINDKMALRADGAFCVNVIRNLKSACIYASIYVPLSFVFDVLVGVAMFFLLFLLLKSVIPFLVSLFLFIAVIVFAIAIKMTFTSDWLPALVRGKLGHGGAIKYTFNCKGKQVFAVLSNYVVLILLIFAINVAALICTFGVGLLLSIPASYVMLISFEFVNYYDRENVKYFVDKYTIIKPIKEREPTREEFFRGDDEE